MGFFLNKIEPRRFRFQPFYYKPDDEKRIRFQRRTSYDPHERNRTPWVAMVLFIIVALLIVFLGGLRPSAKPPILSVEDAAGVVYEVDKR